MKSAESERVAESLDRLEAHRLGPIKGYFPAAEIELRALLRRCFAHAQVVGEIGSAAHCRSVARDRLEPAQRSLKKSDRRHQDDRKSAVQWLQNATDQSHIVVGRQPDYSHAFRADA